MKTAIVKKILEAHCQRWLKGIWQDTPKEHREAFLADESDLAVYHHSIGQSMRNECGLWKYADLLDEHPDDFSHRMLVKFRGRVQESTYTISQLPNVLGV
ncbi:hypothetical protein VPHD480_0365 [Vibrio phage D480]|nr:hypothetical protein MYOV011v1_p0259 [Vibrio phage 6E35.1a]